MRAIRVREFGGPDVLRLEETPDPVPGPGQVLVRVHAVGVNPVETYVRAGTYGKLPALPFTPGTDAAGVVEAVGDGVRGPTVGDRVYTHGTLSGAYAELALCEAAQVHPLPARASFAQGAGVGVAAGAAWRALFHRGGARPNEIVLVHGATGGVGTAAVQLARSAGLTVIATAGSDRGRQLAAEQGAHYVLGHDATDGPEQIRNLTDGKGVDLILEMLANVNLVKDLAVLAPRGRVVVIGSRGSLELDPRLTMGSELTILGMSLWNASADEMSVMHAALSAALGSGALQPVVGLELPLGEAARAHREVMEGRSYGKIILVPA